MPREAAFPIPLKYIDVTRATSASLDVMLEESIDDYWNVDGDRDLSATWTVFTRFTILDEKPRDGYTWSGERLTRKQTTSRPDSLWPEIWKDMSEASTRKEKQKWAIEKPKLDNARRLRGIYFIDHEDEEFKLTMKKAQRKLEVPMPAAMPCKTRGREYSCSARKTPYACIVGPDESTRKRLEGTLHKDHEDHIAGKGISWEKLEKIQHDSRRKSEKRMIADARKEGKTVHFAPLMDICHLKNSELEPKFKIY